MRKNKIESKRRNEDLRIRVTADEKRRIEKAAEKTGQSVSAWLRLAALKMAVGLVLLLALILAGCTSGLPAGDYIVEEIEPNNDVPTANATPDGPVTLTGSLDATDIDCWRISEGTDLDLVGDIAAERRESAVCISGHGTYALILER